MSDWGKSAALEVPRMSHTYQVTMLQHAEISNTTDCQRRMRDEELMPECGRPMTRTQIQGVIRLSNRASVDGCGWTKRDRTLLMSGCGQWNTSTHRQTALKHAQHSVSFLQRRSEAYRSVRVRVAMIKHWSPEWGSMRWHTAFIVNVGVVQLLPAYCRAA